MSVLDVQWSRWQQSGRVGGRAELQDVRLLKSSTQLITFDASAPFKADLDVQASVQRQDDTAFVVSAEYNLRVLGCAGEASDVEPDHVTAEFEFTYVALFSLTEVSDREDLLEDSELEAYADSVGLTTLHPYAREYIQSQTVRVGLPSLTVGVVRIVRDEESQS